MKKLLLSAIAAAAVVAPQLASAESTLNTAAGANTTAAARLDFQITIPRVLFLQVGTSGGLFTDDTTVSLLSASVPVANVADGTNVAFTGGDAAAGAVNVRVFGNNGTISLLATGAAAGLTNAAVGGDNIPWTELLVTPGAGAGGAGFVGTSITHPTINGAATSITATNKVVRQHGTWTFAYDNSQAYAAGTYGGVNTLNSRVTYTATLP
jgi:hypothetical protein